MKQVNDQKQGNKTAMAPAGAYTRRGKVDILRIPQSGCNVKSTARNNEPLLQAKIPPRWGSGGMRRQ